MFKSAMKAQEPFYTFDASLWQCFDQEAGAAIPKGLKDTNQVDMYHLRVWGPSRKEARLAHNISLYKLTIIGRRAQCQEEEAFTTHPRAAISFAPTPAPSFGDMHPKNQQPGPSLSQTS